MLHAFSGLPLGQDYHEPLPLIMEDGTAAPAFVRLPEIGMGLFLIDASPAVDMIAAPLDAATDQPSTFMGEGAHVSLVRVEDALLFEESWRTATLALGAIRLAALANDQGWGDSIPGVPLPFSIAIDGEPTTLIENLEACADPDAVCDSEDLIRVCALRPGGIAHSGAGAYAMLTVTRPREPHPMVREALASV